MKESLQGESAGEKAQEKSKGKAALTRMAYSHSKTWSPKVPCEQGGGGALPELVHGKCTDVCPNEVQVEFHTGLHELGRNRN